MDGLILFELVLAMLLAAVALHYLANRLRVPPAAVLILGGAVLAFVPGLPPVTLEPELVLVLFLPPLLMDGAWVIPLRHLRRHLVGILSLAVGAVIFTTAVVALVTHMLMPDLPWAACAVLGAIVSAPDAISARAVLQRVQLPPRLAILLEGESLLNDAAGLVLFRFAVAAAVTGAFSAFEAVGSFLLIGLGGAAVGAVMGALWVYVAKRLHDEYLVTALTALTCWGTYLLAERLQVSGVIATVVTGLVCGWYQHAVLSAAIRVRSLSFWHVMIFLLEASVFILIGFELQEVIERAGGLHVVLDQMLEPTFWILLALTLARVAWVFLSDAITELCHRLGLARIQSLGWRGSAVLSWAGMRGVATLAVALSVPDDVPGRDFIVVASFIVILVTVLLQGTTLGFVIRHLRPPEAGSHVAPLNLADAQAALAEVQAKLVEQRSSGPEGVFLDSDLLEAYRHRSNRIRLYSKDPEQHRQQLQAHLSLKLEAIAAARSELLRLHRSGQIDNHVLYELERNLDLEELVVRSARR